MSESNTGLGIALAQLNFRVGDLEANADKMFRAMERAREEGADLIVFSELSLLGYPPRDMVHRRGLLKRQWELLDELAARTDENFAAIIGFVGEAEDSAGHRLFNGAAFCHRKEVRRQVAKQLLPTYDVFEELRYFHPLPTDGVITYGGVRIGLSICEDAWARVSASQMPTYAEDPLEELARQGAQILINIAASPFSIDKGGFRRDLLSDHCERLGCPLVFVNQVGGNDELIFDGRSLVLDSQGSLRARLAEFEEDFRLVTVEASGSVNAGGPTPVCPVAESRAAQARDAVVLGIRDYVEKSNFEGVVLGLSGGIDSSLTATLAVDALGADAVRGVAMPSRFSSDHSREDARILAENLGIRFEEIPIDAAYGQMLETLRPHFHDPDFGVTEENIQARIRGVYLMALSNKSGDLVLASGNKSELAVGYTTLYGDMCGALAVIGDLPKMLVYEIARLYNEEANGVLIPRRVLTKAPSAELRPDQKDEDSLPPYERLDEILRRYITEHQTIEEIVDAGFDESTVREVVAGIHRSEFKRWQAPPILKVSDKAFGVGWRYPLAAVYGW